MKVIVLGTGAIGAYYGAQLARAGHAVTCFARGANLGAIQERGRSEEHTSELQSHSDLVCRLLLEKKKKKTKNANTQTTKQDEGPVPQPHISPRQSALNQSNS